MKNIVLVGFLGAGKSTVAPVLAKTLKLEFLEMDQLIRDKAGMSIKEIYAQRGEVGMREFEIAVAKELQHVQDMVVSTSAGVVMNKINFDYWEESARVVHLFAPFEVILERIRPRMPRPLIEDEERARSLYDLRMPLLDYYSDIRVSTENRSVEEVVEEIQRKVESL